VTTRIGILSAAHFWHAQREVRDTLARGDRVVGASDSVPDRAAALLEDAGIDAPVYEDPRKLIDEVEMDAVFIHSENHTHLELVRLAADAGLPMLVEKPLAPDLESAREIERLAAEKGLIMSVAYNMRYAPGWAAAKRAIDDGLTGDVKAVQMWGAYRVAGDIRFGDHTWSRDWLRDERAGGGALVDHAVHHIDLFRWLTGAEVEEVYAILGVEAAECAVDTNGIVSGRATGGILFTLEEAWLGPGAAGHAAAPAPWIVMGTKGTVIGGSPPRIHTGGDMVELETPEVDGTVTDQFLDAVASGGRPEITAHDGVAGVAVFAAAYESARTGEPVKVRL